MALDTSIMNELKEILVENANACDLQGKCLHERSIKLLDVLRLSERSEPAGLSTAYLRKPIKVVEFGTRQSDTPIHQVSDRPNGHEKHVLSTIRKEYLSTISNRVEGHSKTRLAMNHQEFESDRPTYSPHRMSTPSVTQTVEHIQTPYNEKLDRNEICTQTEHNVPTVSKNTDLTQICVSVQCTSVQASLINQSVLDTDQQQSFRRTESATNHK
jgi:hypothetical protein